MILLLPYACDLFAQEMVTRYAGDTATIIPGAGPTLPTGGNVLSPPPKKELDISLISASAKETIVDAINNDKSENESMGKAFLRILRQRFSKTQYSSYSAPNGLIVYLPPNKH